MKTIPTFLAAKVAVIAPRDVPGTSFRRWMLLFSSVLLRLPGIARSSRGAVMATLLAPALHGADFTNAFVTTIPASGNATPYPSTVTVSGVSGPVTSVQVRITGFTHTYPVDVDVFLVAPNGAVAAVFSDAGGFRH